MHQDEVSDGDESHAGLGSETEEDSYGDIRKKRGSGQILSSDAPIPKMGAFGIPIPKTMSYGPGSSFVGTASISLRLLI